MEHRQLTYVLAVSEHGSFTRAAEACFVVQSALSQQIRKLEEELGVRIFDRTTRSVSLTPDGEILVPVIRRAVTAVEGVRQTAEGLSGAVRGRVVVGLMSVPPSTLRVPDLVARFHRDHPQVELAIVSGHGSHLRTQLRQGEVDCAFVGIPAGPVEDDLSIEATVVEPLCLVVSPEDDLAGLAEVSAAELSGMSFVDFPAGYALRAELDRLLPFERRVAFEVSRVEQVAQFVTRGLAVAVLPQSVADEWAAREPMATVALAGGPTRTVALVRPTSRPGTAAARAFIDLALGHLAR